MGGFLNGLGTLLGGFNVKRRIDEDGFDFREQDAQREFERQKAQEEYGTDLASNYMLGAENPDPEVLNNAFGDKIDKARREFLLGAARGGVANSKAALKAQDLNARWQEKLLTGGQRLGEIGARGEEQRATAEARAKLAAGMPITAYQQELLKDADARQASYDKRTDMYANRPTGGGLGGDGGGLTSAGLDAAARQYATTGQMPTLGMGSSGARQAIINRAAELYSGLDVAGNAARYRAGTGALNNVAKVKAAVGAFEDTATKNSEILKNTLRKIPDLGAAPLNQAARAVSNALGSVEMSQFNAAIQSVRNEYARIISNPSLTGVMSDTARREGEVLLNPNATVAQILGALEILQAEARNRRMSFDSVESELLGGLGGSSAPPPGVGGGSGTADDPYTF